MADETEIAAEMARLLAEAQGRIERLNEIEREVAGLRASCERMIDIMAWAQENGICIFGHNHNSDGKWSATLGMYHVGGHDRLLDAVAALKAQHDGDVKAGGNNG